MKRYHVWLSTDLCLGCGDCVKICPKKLISLKNQAEKTVAEIKHPERCAACGKCSLVCKSGALEVYEN